jgi:holin-like protein
MRCDDGHGIESGADLLARPETLADAGASMSPAPGLEETRMLITEALRVLACLCAGEILSGVGLLPFPGPVIGLVFLLANLALIGAVPEPLGRLADHVLAVLGMLFVPTGVGLLAYADLLHREFAPIAAAILGGTVVTIVVTALTAKRLAELEAQKGSATEGEATDAAA